MTIQQMADDAVAKYMAEYEAGHCEPTPTTPTPEQQLAQSRFRELVTEHALLHGVRPAAVRHVLRDAEAVFELKEGTLAPRNNATDPADPLSPLSPVVWLQELAKTDGYLFAAPGRTH